MKWQLVVAVMAVLCFSLFCSYPTQNIQAQAKGKAVSVEQKITVLSPMGTPPPVQLKPMPPRLNTLEGKTIYVVDQGYLGTDNLLKEMIVWLEKEYPKTNFVFRRLGMSMGPQPPPLYAEIKEKADAMIMALGHWSVCAPAVTGHCIDVESTLGKPTVPIIISSFIKQVQEIAMTKGMPNLRFAFIRGPVWAKTPDQLRRDVVEGKRPISGQPVMQEIIENLTKPLTAEEKKTGELKRSRGPEYFTGTPEDRTTITTVSEGWHIDRPSRSTSGARLKAQELRVVEC